MEKWKTIQDYKCYFISDKGRVLSKSRKVRYVHAVTGNEHWRKLEEKFLQVYHNNQTGYKFVQLRNIANTPKNITIHRLVALTFLFRSKDKNFVNHKDGNKHNNTVENLEWCTNTYNHEHATRTGLKAKGDKIGSSKLNNNSIIAIRKLINSGWKDVEIAGLFEVSRSNITHIKLGVTWKHVALSDGKELIRKHNVSKYAK